MILAAAASPVMDTLGRLHFTVVHFPLALTLMALAVWLPLRAARPR